MLGVGPGHKHTLDSRNHGSNILWAFLGLEQEWDL